jgi:hypothetical protein
MCFMAILRLEVINHIDGGSQMLTWHFPVGVLLLLPRGDLNFLNGKAGLELRRTFLHPPSLLPSFLHH